MLVLHPFHAAVINQSSWDSKASEQQAPGRCSLLVTGRHSNVVVKSMTLQGLEQLK